MARYWFKVVTRAGEGLGFRLAGAPVEEIVPGQEAERFKALVADESLGVLAVEQELLERVPEALLERIERGFRPAPFAFPKS
jgi:vacuolar-type H+-ATPase subunit F/Vma7